MNNKNKIITGVFNFHVEQGNVAFWCIEEEDNLGCDGLYVPSNGDELTLYEDEHRESIIWQGTVDYGNQQQKTAMGIAYPFNMVEVIRNRYRFTKKKMSTVNIREAIDDLFIARPATLVIKR